MLRRIFFIILIIIIIICLATLINCTQKKSFDVKFKEEIIDFGTVNAGVTIKTDFEFKNTGTETIEIKVVRPTCKCTAPGDWDQFVEPGKTGRIPIKFNTEPFEGDTVKVIFLDTNIPGRESIQLILKGIIYSPVQINPKTIWLGEIRDEEKSLYGNFPIKYNLNTPFIVSEIVPPDENTECDLITIEPGKEYRLDVTVNPPFERYEITRKKIILKIGGKVNKDFTLIYSYLLPAPVQVNPLNVYLDMDKLKEEPFEQRINIKSNIDEPIRVLAPKWKSKGVAFSVEELRKDNYYQIPLVFPLGFTFPEDEKIFFLTFRVQNDPRDIEYIITVKEKETK